jgi:hypothetical protein
VVDGLSCKLPVYTIGQQGSGGFISFPSGATTADSSSGNLHVAGGGTDWFGLTYDNAVQRWLPVPSTWVTPDGLLYAYAVDWDSHAAVNFLSEINAQTGASSNLGSVGTPWQVIGVSSANIYAGSIKGPGVYVQPIAGPFQPAQTSDGYWIAASGFFVYGTAVPDGGAVVRMDVRNPSQRVAWFNKSNTAEIIGFDGSGSPVIWTGTDLWIASAPDQATRIGSVAPLPSPQASGVPIHGALAPVADSHGLWFSTTDGIYLYTGGQTTKVSNLVAQVAGGCN